MVVLYSVAVPSASSFVSVDERRFVTLSPYGGVVCGRTRRPFFGKIVSRRDSADALRDATENLDEDGDSPSTFKAELRLLRVGFTEDDIFPPERMKSERLSLSLRLMETERLNLGREGAELGVLEGECRRSVPREEWPPPPSTKVRGRAFRIIFAGARETGGLGEEFVRCRRRRGSLLLTMLGPGLLDVEALGEDTGFGGSARCLE
jgi:hypothetical protein